MYQNENFPKMKKLTILLTGALCATIPGAVAFHYRSNALNILNYQNQAALHSSQGNYEAAVIDYTKAININPKDANLYSNRGDVYKRLGYYQLAIHDYTQAIKISPTTKYFEQRAKIWDELKEFDKANADRKGINIDS
ncbi:MAG: tetratricopeptide repeat protein [Calothrix sp. C42_A2020_038]|nr:tetratricopeptide repeat protein [Calothrix sp. C42_A2020_038]